MKNSKIDYSSFQQTVRNQRQDKQGQKLKDTRITTSQLFASADEASCKKYGHNISFLVLQYWITASSVFEAICGITVKLTLSLLHFIFSKFELICVKIGTGHKKHVLWGHIDLDLWPNSNQFIFQSKQMFVPFTKCC